MSLTLDQEVSEYLNILGSYRTLFEQDGVITPDEQAQLDSLESKINQILGAIGSEKPAAPSAPPVPAPSNSAGSRVVAGAGGYEYEQFANGDIFIVKSPGGSGRTQVKAGSTAYNAILAEIGPFPASGGSGPAAPSAPPASGGGSSGPGYGSDPELPPGSVPANLEQLMAKEELSADEIAEARRLIEQQPAELQDALYEQLQEKTEYCNQRNNDALETSSGGTCNLTAVAMALEYLGIKNPYPQMDFDEALVKIAQDNNYGSITSASTWTKVASYLGVKNSEIFASSVKQKQDWWQTNVDNKYLKKGYGVVMSLDGHVIRLQAVTDAGLVVDDPYGASKLSGRTFDDGRPKYSFSQSNDANAEDGDDAGNHGNDTGYPWADVEKYTFKYLMAFK